MRLEIKPYLVDSTGGRHDVDSRVVSSEKGTSIAINIADSVTVREIVLIDIEHGMAASTTFYGDGYSKLSQYGGTVGNPIATTYFSDKDHYKMPQTSGMFTAYNYAYFYDDINNTTLIGALTGAKYRLEIRLNALRLQVVQCCENKPFVAGDVITLEDIIIMNGERGAILDRFGDMIAQRHDVKKYHECPVGWCSWYCIGHNISEKAIYDNLKDIKRKAPELKYIQIDDGFQPFMGDWLETGDKFTSPMRDICHEIRAQGFEPAIWLAPFIASGKSKLFREHPEYFVKDNSGNPLLSSTVSFGGWRDAPWYCIDGTHPGARKFITDTVRTIYNEWGVKYYKLDANVWGALPFGNHYDASATCMEAYHRGMDAIWEAVGNDAFVLGCNAPMWASIGQVTGMRVTGDTVRNIQGVASLTHECFNRNWMNNKLWVNDPDCLLLASKMPKLLDFGGKLAASKLGRKMYKLNIIYIRASGGMVLSGDYVGKYGRKQVEILRRVIGASHISARFDEAQEVGIIDNADCREMVFFCKKANARHEVSISEGYEVIDMYDNVKLRTQGGKLVINMRRNGAEWIKIVKQQG